MPVFGSFGSLSISSSRCGRQRDLRLGDVLLARQRAGVGLAFLAPLADLLRRLAGLTLKRGRLGALGEVRRVDARLVGAEVLVALANFSASDGLFIGVSFS